MLELMRRHAYSWGIKVLLGFIAVVMTFWGIGTGFFNQVHPVATVDGTRILPDEIDQEANRLRQTIQNMYGANATAVLKSMNLRQEALDRIIENRLIANEARHLGVQISNQALEDQIETQKAFQVDGRFDFRSYQEVLRENGMLPTDYETAIRAAMTADTLQHMIDDGVQVAADEVRHAYDLQNQKIGLAYVKLGWRQFSAKISPTDKQVADYYAAHREEFREPERVKIEYIHYAPLVMASKVVPSDQDIEYYYKSNLKSRFTHPEMAHASHILISVPEGATEKEKAAAKARAEDVLRQIGKGGDFKQLAAKYSDDTSNRLDGGDLGWFPHGQMIKPFEDAVFKMKPGQLEIVETRFGYHVVKLDGIKPAHTDTLAEARPQIIDALRTTAGAKLAREAIDHDLSAALSGKSLAEVAKARGLDVAQPPPFAESEEIPGVGRDPKFAAAAFGLDAGQVRAVPAAGGAPFLIKMVQKFPAHIPPLKEIEAKVRAAYVRSTAEAEARAAAKKLLAQAKSPADLHKVAAENQLAVQSVDPFPRASHEVPGVGEFPEVTDAAAVMSAVPGVFDRVMERDGDSYIFELTSRAAPDEQDWSRDQTQFTEQYVGRKRAQVWTRFLDGLKSRAKIVINADQLGAASSSSM
jgi:peptidyl-prolyl cis-trans isomerase D